MFSWLGNQIDGALNGYVTMVIAALMAYLGPIVMAAMTLWILIYGFAVMRGEVSEPITTFAWKMVKNALIVAFATSVGVYQSGVIDVANGLLAGLVSMFSPPGSPLASMTSVWAVLDAFNDQASNLVTEVLKEGVLSLDSTVGIISGVIFSIGNTIFEAVALYVIVVAKVIMTFVLAVGPLFILCLVFRPTSQFFFSWLGMLASTLVLVCLAFFVLGFSLYLSDRIVATALANLGAINLIGESLRYMVICLVLGLLLYQAPSLAAGLAGGSPAQMGAQMASQTVMAWRAMRGNSDSAAPTNSLHRGGGLAYRAGAAMGSSGSKVAGAGKRWAAYQVSAMRGRLKQR